MEYRLAASFWRPTTVWPPPLPAAAPAGHRSPHSRRPRVRGTRHDDPRGRRDGGAGSGPSTPLDPAHAASRRGPGRAPTRWTAFTGPSGMRKR